MTHIHYFTVRLYQNRWSVSAKYIRKLLLQYRVPLSLMKMSSERFESRQTRVLCRGARAELSGRKTFGRGGGPKPVLPRRSRRIRRAYTDMWVRCAICGRRVNKSAADERRRVAGNDSAHVTPSREPPSGNDATSEPNNGTRVN